MLRFETPWGIWLDVHVQPPPDNRRTGMADTDARDIQCLLLTVFVQVLLNLVQQHTERMRAWINEFEVLHALKQLKIAGVLLRQGSSVVPQTDLMRHGSVVGPMDQRMRHAEGQQLNGRALHVPLRKILAKASQERGHDVVAEAQAGALGQIDGAGQRNGATVLPFLEQSVAVPATESDGKRRQSEARRKRYRDTSGSDFPCGK